MKNCFYSKNGDVVTVSNVRFTEKINGKKIKAEKGTVDMDMLKNNQKIISSVENETITFKDAPKSPEDTTRQDLKQKLEAGTATQKDIEEALKILL